jgi:hypothetical protein
LTSDRKFADPVLQSGWNARCGAMKDEYKAQSSPAGIPRRHGEADDFASGRALAYE